MIALILVCIVLTAMVGTLCLLIHSKQADSTRKVQQQQEMLANLDMAFKGIAEQQLRLFKRIDQLATDVLQREIYQNADDRHHLAIQSARQGKGIFELIQRHGLSSDEAGLLMDLHSPQASSDDKNEEQEIKNANLYDPTSADVA